MCEMLTDVLTPLIRSNQPLSCTRLSPALLADWHATVLRLKNEVGQWVNKHGKHTNVSRTQRTAAAAPQSHFCALVCSVLGWTLLLGIEVRKCKQTLAWTMLFVMLVGCTAVHQVGYPLVTVLVCLVDGENHTKQVDSMAEFLVKQMKLKEYR